MNRLVVAVSLILLVAIGATVAWLAVRDFRRRPSLPTTPGESTASSPTERDVLAEVLERLGTPQSPKADDSPVRIYRVASPDCPFEELAVVRVSVPGSGGDQAVRRVLRSKIESEVRAMGGDAVGALHEYETVDVRSGVGMVALGFARACWTGVVLRFKDSDCGH